MNADALYGLVLAGGRSRRMGSDKALLVKDGRTQLERLVRLLEAHTGRVFVSARTDQQDEPERRRFARIVDRYEGIGPLAGILSAMDEHPEVDWLVVACDLPNVDHDTLSRLVAEHAAGRPFVAYRSSHDGLPEPLCAIYRRGSDAILRRFVDEGIVCPRKILIRSDTALLEQPVSTALDNLNTPEDLARSSLGLTP